MENIFLWLWCAFVLGTVNELLRRRIEYLRACIEEIKSGDVGKDFAGMVLERDRKHDQENR